MNQEKEYAYLSYKLKMTRLLGQSLYIVIVQDPDYITPGIIAFRKIFIIALIRQLIETRKAIDELREEVSLDEESLKEICIDVPGG